MSTVAASPLSPCVHRPHLQRGRYQVWKRWSSRHSHFLFPSVSGGFRCHPHVLGSMAILGQGFPVDLSIPRAWAGGGWRSAVAASAALVDLGVSWCLSCTSCRHPLFLHKDNKDRNRYLIHHALCTQPRLATAKHCIFNFCLIVRMRSVLRLFVQPYLH